MYIYIIYHQVFAEPTTHIFTNTQTFTYFLYKIIHMNVYITHIKKGYINPIYTQYVC